MGVDYSPKNIQDYWSQVDLQDKKECSWKSLEVQGQTCSKRVQEKIMN